LDIEELKKDVEAFSNGVKRLEQLEVEFKKINTSGHEKEAEEIRSMLKNVSAIPELELRISKLKTMPYRRNGFRYKFNRAFPLVVKKQNDAKVNKSSKESELLERKYEFLLEENNNEIYSEIKSLKESIKSLANTLKITKTQGWQQEKELKFQNKMKNNVQIVKTKNPSNSESRKFLKCKNLLLSAEIAIQDKDKLRARKLYLELGGVYSNLGYPEKKKIYNRLINLYNKLSKLYRER